MERVMRRKDLESLSPEQVSALTVVIQRVQQYNRWRTIINGETLVRGDEFDLLSSDLERVQAYLTQIGIKEFRVLTHESA